MRQEMYVKQVDTSKKSRRAHTEREKETGRGIMTLFYSSSFCVIIIIIIPSISSVITYFTFPPTLIPYCVHLLQLLLLFPHSHSLILQ